MEEKKTVSSIEYVKLSNLGNLSKCADSYERNNFLFENSGRNAYRKQALKSIHFADRHAKKVAEMTGWWDEDRLAKMN